MARQPRIEIHLEADRQRLRLESTYDAAFVAGLKEAVPARDRTWDEVGKMWYVAATHAERVRLLAFLYPKALWVEGQQETDLHTGRTMVRLPPAEQLGLWA